MSNICLRAFETREYGGDPHQMLSGKRATAETIEPVTNREGLSPRNDIDSFTNRRVAPITCILMVVSALRKSSATNNRIQFSIK